MRVVMRGITRAELDAKLDTEDLLSELFQKADVETGIIAAQHKDGAFLKLKVKAPGPDAIVWSDWRALALFAAASGAVYGFGGSAYGYLT